jgi:hypothetical protein
MWRSRAIGEKLEKNFPSVERSRAKTKVLTAFHTFDLNLLFIVSEEGEI